MRVADQESQGYFLIRNYAITRRQAHYKLVAPGGGAQMGFSSEWLNSFHDSLDRVGGGRADLDMFGTNPERHRLSDASA